MSNQETYRAFAHQQSSILIFQDPIWLDAVVGRNSWDVAIAKKGNQIVGAFPYVTKKKLGFFQITIPILTYYLGPIFFYPSDILEENKKSFQRKVLQDLIEDLPATDRFVTQTNIDFDYWLPFYWKGFKQTTKYTYILDTKNELESIFSKFKPTIKKAIQKAEKSFTVRTTADVTSLFELHKNDYEVKGLKTAFELSQLQNIQSKIGGENRSIVLEAVDHTNKTVAAIFLLKDQVYHHYMFGAVNQEHRKSGVMSLLIWHAIQMAKMDKVTFNFGGSMNKTIEQYFSGFKGTIKPYMSISKVSHPLLKPFNKFNQ